MNKTLLDQRKKAKSRKPTFLRQDSHKRKRIRKRWQKPRGWQSKMRLQKKGYNKLVSPGYGSPKEVYALNKDGFEIIKVSSLSELKDIDNKKQGIEIAASVGNKKRIDIIKKAQESQIKILNIKDPSAFIKKVEDDLKSRKDNKKIKEEKKKEAEKKKVKKKEEGLKEKVSEEDKKEAEKKEKEKILTKKENK